MNVSELVTCSGMSVNASSRGLVQPPQLHPEVCSIWQDTVRVSEQQHLPTCHPWMQKASPLRRVASPSGRSSMAWPQQMAVACMGEAHEWKRHSQSSSPQRQPWSCTWQRQALRGWPDAHCSAWESVLLTYGAVWLCLVHLPHRQRRNARLRLHTQAQNPEASPALVASMQSDCSVPVAEHWRCWQRHLRIQQLDALYVSRRTAGKLHLGVPNGHLQIRSTNTNIARNCSVQIEGLLTVCSSPNSWKVASGAAGSGGGASGGCAASSPSAAPRNSLMHPQTRGCDHSKHTEGSNGAVHVPHLG